MPIIYIIHKGWGAEEVPILNTNQKNWVPSDFVKMYVEMGKEAYLKYEEFNKRYGLTHHANMFLLLGGSRKKDTIRSFEKGTFEIKKWNWANIMAKQILELKEYYPGFKRFGFIAAYVHLTADKNFDHAVLMEKLQFQSRKLVDCTTVDEYYELLREIYNFRTRTESRIIKQIEV